ncbi:RBBP9/YdeN family alpha/beta hydrolase [Actinosynnema sp. CA-248983]
MGELTVAHWVAGGGRPVKGALLVTPADVERNPDPAIRGFAPIPRTPFPFPTIVAASRTYRWMTPERAQEFADAWGAKLVDVGPVGHLTVAEGPGSRPAGRALLDQLLQGIRASCSGVRFKEAAARAGPGH